MSPVYDEIGTNYAARRQPDPRIGRAILKELDCGLRLITHRFRTS